MRGERFRECDGEMRAKREKEEKRGRKLERERKGRRKYQNTPNSLSEGQYGQFLVRFDFQIKFQKH